MQTTRWAERVIELLEGDCRKVLKTLPADSIQCCVTSPPYLNMRDYGVAGQMGLEQSIDAHVRALVRVFREVRRVLEPRATLWLNYGDSYAEGGRGGHRRSGGFHGHPKRKGDLTGKRKRLVRGGVKPKDLIGMPWRIALALQRDGWWLRSCIIWEKPSAMPESVHDRPTSAHEYVFLLAKSRRYYYDAESIAEPRAADTDARAQRARAQSYAPPGQSEHNGICGARDGKFPASWASGPGSHKPVEHNKGDRKTFRGGGKYTHNEGFSPDGKANQQRGNREVEGTTRNARTVWRIPATPTSVAHFATFPPELARRCILAGCPPGGRVLDIFSGYGTVGLVADRFQRHATLIELNPAYIKLARDRIHADAPLLSQITETRP